METVDDFDIGAFLRPLVDRLFAVVSRSANVSAETAAIAAEEQTPLVDGEALRAVLRIKAVGESLNSGHAGAGGPHHGLCSNTMALITSDRGANQHMDRPPTRWP